METGKVEKLNPLMAGMGFIGDAMNVSSAIMGYNNQIENGENPAIAAMTSAFDFTMGEVFYGSVMANAGIVGGIGASLAGIAIGSAADLTFKHMRNTSEKLSQGSENLKTLGSGHFDMTQAGYTMRQRSLNAIRNNGARLSSAFGNEARNYYLGL